MKNPITWYSLFICVSLIISCQQNQKSHPDPLPNVVFILADDLGYGDLSFLGQQHFQTPHIDKLAEEGLFFTQHYSGNTVCAPSRCALLTGQHTGHAFVRGNKEVNPIGQFPLADSIVTMAEVFKGKGYKTGIFGKWGLGFPASEGDPRNQGFDEFYGYNCQRVGHKYYPPHLWDNEKKIELSANQKGEQKDYGPALIHDKTIEFISKHKEKPFFLFVASIIPHAELYAPDSYFQKYKGKLGKEKPYIASVPQDPLFNIGAYDSQTEPHAHFAGMVNLLDDQVGEIVTKLKELGIYENTLIIFSSDNGPHKEGGADPEYFNSNGKFRGFKRDLYEGGIRVPLIAHWKNKIKPGSSDHISAFWDFFPTFAELIDAEVQANDGISMLPTFFNYKENQKKHDYLYWEFHELGGRQAVRQNNWKAVKLNVNKPDQTTMELYNLQNDPSEQNNLANSQTQKALEMDSIMQVAHTENPIFKFLTK